MLCPLTKQTKESFLHRSSSIIASWMKMDPWRETSIKEGSGWNIILCHGVRGPMAVWESSLLSTPSDSESATGWQLKKNNTSAWMSQLHVSSVFTLQVCLHAVDQIPLGAVWPKCPDAGGKCQSLWIWDVTARGGLAYPIQTQDKSLRPNKKNSFMHISTHCSKCPYALCTFVFFIYGVCLYHTIEILWLFINKCK